jgi:hypothetical protein
MTTQRDLERALDTFFELGADELADRVIDDALLTIEHTPQRRAWRVPWRFLEMPSSLKFATVAVVVIVAIGGAAWMLGRDSGSGVGGQPSASAPPSASPTPSPAPSPVPSPTPVPTFQTTDGWLPFTSSRYGFEIAYPPTWKAEAATRDWVFATDHASNLLEGQADGFIGGPGGNQVRVSGFSADVPAGTSEDEWLTSYYVGIDCYLAAPDFLPITVDGHPGRLDSTCFAAQAFVFIGERVYVISIWRTEYEPLLRTFLSTIKFQASPSSSSGASPSPS